MRAHTIDLLEHYGATEPDKLDLSPAWCIAIIRLGQPLTYSRQNKGAKSSVVKGAFTRKEKPLIIYSDLIQLSIQGSKRNYAKALSATIKNSGTNYLSRDQILPGDWIFAWMHSDEEKILEVIEKVKLSKAANGFESGLKFVGRIDSIRKTQDIDHEGRKRSLFSLAAVGFNELDTQLFYDQNLATQAAGSDLPKFMAQLGRDFFELAGQQVQEAGNLKDNGGYLLETFIDIVLGKGISADANRPAERANEALNEVNGNISDSVSVSKLVPQANREAPFAYLVPNQVGEILGMPPQLKSKSGLFGYADILQRLIGVQKYNKNRKGFLALIPELKKLKGTFLPVGPSFVNKPLWSLMTQYLNPAINEAYTAMKPDESGNIYPTLVVRQVPYSSESIKENQEFPLTRLLDLPRWKIPPVIVRRYDIGRSNATRTNMVYVTGQAAAFAQNRSATHQIVRNPPIYDSVDIQRSGIRGRMMKVDCAVGDQLDAPGSWMEAISDWSMGSHLYLNGTIECYGIDLPLCEGDNIEFLDQVFHVESIAHQAAVEGGRKTFITTLTLSHGMPVNQESATDDFPRYSGFLLDKEAIEEDSTKVLDIEENQGSDDPFFATELDPGVTNG